MIHERRLSPRLAAAVYFLGAAVLAFFVGRNVAVKLRFEDALIVLRYARNLLAGEGFVFNPGERVLGVTTPLHTLASTLYVGLSPENAPALQNLAGLLFLVLGGFMVLVLMRRMGYPYLGLAAALLTLDNFNANYLYFGMEVHLFAFLVLLAFHLFIDGKEAACGVVLGLAFLTRYDAALPAALIGTGLLIEKKRFPWRLVTGFAVPVAPWLVFAQLYFGSIVPNPLAAKKGYHEFFGYLHYVFFYYKATFKKVIGLYAPIELLKAGLSYLYLVPVLLAVARATLADRRWLLLGVYPFLHVAVYAAIGSDSGFTWHYYVLNPTFFMFFAIGVYEIARALLSPLGRRLAPRFPALPRLAPVVLALAAVLPLAGHAVRQMGHRYETDPHTRQLFAMAAWMKERYDPETTLLQPAIGILGYVTGFRMIDHAGLVTPGLYFFDDEHCTPMDEVLARFQPDLILLSAASRADVAAHGYQLVKVFAEPYKYSLFERNPP